MIMLQGLYTCFPSSWNISPQKAHSLVSFMSLLICHHRERTSLTIQYKIADLGPYLHHPLNPALFYSIVHITTQHFFSINYLL